MVHESGNPTLPLSHSTSNSHRLGLLGGSFNPIHNGHLAIAHHVYKSLSLDRILFIPTGDPPHKEGKSLASPKDRLEMVRLAIAGTSFFEASTVELDRAGKSYSIDTVREVQKQYGPSWALFFIIGLDAFLEFPTWRAPRELLQICHFVVVPRPGQSFQTLSTMDLFSTLDIQALTQLDGGILSQLDIPVPGSFGITCLPIPPCSISASEIRKRVQSRQSLANMLPPSVESYILHSNLYQEDNNRTRI